MHAASPEVVFEFPRRATDSVAYQRYFLLALEEVSRLRLRGESLVARPLRRVDDKIDAHVHAARLALRLRLPLRLEREAGMVGRYELRNGDRTVRFAIDAADSHPVADEAALAWSDVYFKANLWPAAEYDEKVEPLVNGNGVLTRRRLAELVRLRGREKEFGVVYVANVWGGREHGVRLFERLAELDGPNRLIAVFPWGFDPDETAAYRARLEAIGVETRERPVPLRELWDLMSRGRIVFSRPGKHLCLPWRTLDTLAMGACLVLDSPPFPRWYEPLRPGVNYVDCAIERPADTSPAADEAYDRIVPTVAGLLGEPDRAHAIGEANAAYFDSKAAPPALGAHLLQVLTDSA